VVTTLAALLFLATAQGKPDFVHSLTPADSLIRAGETHFAHLWKMSPDENNACPRWSRDSEGLVIETVMGFGCPHARVVRAGPYDKVMTRDVSDHAMSPSFTGMDVVVFAKLGTDSCRASAQHWREAKWSLFPESKLHVEDTALERLELAGISGAMEPDASLDGKQIVFTATPAIDPELYVAHADGSNVRRLTVDQGYDGGGCFSPNGQLICYQAFYPRLETDKAIYTDLLAKHLVDTSTLDIWIVHPDGSDRGQVTDLEGTSMEPSFTPDSKRIIFSSDYQDVAGRQFDLYITKLDGGTPEKITNDPGPDCFPMFSPNGRYLAFTSGRGAKTAGAQNVFIAEWKE
jgi:dipeptidyl aminopeptidase/acylaminoacyl peptidase